MVAFTSIVIVYITPQITKYVLGYTHYMWV